MSGIEVIGAAAAIVQVADTGLRLSQTIYQYLEDVKSANKRLLQLAQDVERTSEIVQSVAALLDDYEIGRKIATKGLETADACVQDCKETFEQIQKFIGSVSKRSKWAFPFKEEKLRLLDARLEKSKTNLSLILIVVGKSAELRDAIENGQSATPGDLLVFAQFRNARRAVQSAEVRLKVKQQQSADTKPKEELDIEQENSDNTNTAAAVLQSTSDGVQAEHSELSVSLSYARRLPSECEDLTEHSQENSGLRDSLSRVSSHGSVVELVESPNDVSTPSIVKSPTIKYNRRSSGPLHQSSDHMSGNTSEADSMESSESELSTNPPRRANANPTVLSSLSILELVDAMKAMEAATTDLNLQVQHLRETLWLCSRSHLNKVELLGLQSMVQHSQGGISTLASMLVSSLSNMCSQGQGSSSRASFEHYDERGTDPMRFAGDGSGRRERLPPPPTPMYLNREVNQVTRHHPSLQQTLVRNSSRQAGPWSAKDAVSATAFRTISPVEIMRRREEREREQREGLGQQSETDEESYSKPIRVRHIIAQRALASAGQAVSPQTIIPGSTTSPTTDSSRARSESPIWKDDELEESWQDQVDAAQQMLRQWTTIYDS